MPADVTLNAGAGGAIIATDPTTSSEHYQLIKLAQGAVGTFTLVTTANAFPVVIGSSFQGGIISLSSQIAVTATGPVTVTSGTVTLSSNPTVISASSGVVQSLFPVNSSAGFGPVSSSAGVLASLSSGTVSLSSQITVTATGPVTVTSGTITLSSNPTVISASSGFVQALIPIMSSAGFAPVTSSFGVTVQSTQPVTITSGLVSITSGVVTATAATNPWSSAPGFNVPIVSVSSGLEQIIPIGVVSSLGYLSTYFQSTGGAASINVRGSASSLVGYSLFNSTAAIRSVKIYNTSSAPAVGSTTNVLLILMAPGSTGGGGANLMLPLPGLFASNGIGFTMTANVAGTDTGAPGSNDLTLNLYII